MERSEREDYFGEEKETTPFEDIEAKLKEEEARREEEEARRAEEEARRQEEERLAKKEKVSSYFYIQYISYLIIV